MSDTTDTDALFAPADGVGRGETEEGEPSTTSAPTVKRRRRRLGEESSEGSSSRTGTDRRRKLMKGSRNQPQAAPSWGSKFARLRWSWLLWIPFIIVLLHREEAVSKQTSGLINVKSVWISIVAICAFSAINELLNGVQWPYYFLSFTGGFAWGSVILAIEDLTALRIGCIAVFGLAAGQLRYHWHWLTYRKGKRRNSKSSLGTVLLTGTWRDVRKEAMGLISKKIGLGLWFMFGEILGCCICVPGGWTLISLSWLGYAMVLVVPITIYTVSGWMSQFIIMMFGNKTNISDASFLLWCYWVLTSVLSIVIMSVTIFYLLFSLVPFLWSLQLLVSPYGMAIEYVALESRLYHRSNPYKEVAEAYKEHIDVTLRENRQLFH